MVPLVVATFGKLGPSAQGFFAESCICYLFYWCLTSWFVSEDCSAVSELCFGSGGGALCSVTTIRVLRKVLGKTFVMVLLCH